MTLPLFADEESRRMKNAQPLAARMRPATLEEFVGQQHLLGEGQLLWRLLRADRLHSVIFYGPPGTGKTTLARLLAHASRRRFHQLNAVTSGVKELREVLEKARTELATGGIRTLLFIDEIHRFNRAQQDALLPDVEDGVVTLVGATTGNPFFTVNSALVSRSQIFQFQPLTVEDIRTVLLRALRDPVRGLGEHDIHLHDDALQFLAEVCDGDARRALNALEIGVLSSDERPLEFTRQLAEDCVQRKAVVYDAAGDEHYDTASALIKSMRGNDPDAAVYWLAKMLEAGEDIRFICRRLVIFASEDVGNAAPEALAIAVAGMQACEFVGLPECQLTLAQVVTYLATAPKSRAATHAIDAARRDVQQGRVQPVPKHLRDAHYAGARRLGHGTGYQNPTDHPEQAAEQSYLGVPKKYYVAPTQAPGTRLQASEDLEREADI